MRSRRAVVSGVAARAHAAASQRPALAEASGGGVQLDEEEFRSMYNRLRAWKERYYECIVPRKVHDAADLGDWVHRMRHLRRNGLLPPSEGERLQEIGFAWEVDVVTAKWYHNLHAARRYKEVHGSGDIPADFADASQPDWVEAARWLERQRDLYRRQKLLLVRVRLLKELLGIKLQREHSKPRRNMHPVLKQGNYQFRAEQRRRQQAAAAHVAEAVQQQQEKEQQEQEHQPSEVATES